MEVKTFYDLKYESSSKIFEAEKIDGFEKLTPDQIQEGEKFYNLLVEKLQKGEEISEGFFTGLLGAGAGALIGPAITKALCSALGIREGGALYNLLTSKLVLGAIGYSLAK